MATINETTFANALKVLYPKGLTEAWYPECPFVAWMPKTTRMKGSGIQLNFITSGVRGSSAFPNAQNNTNSPTLPKMLVTPVNDYVIISLDNRAIQMADDDMGSIARLMDTGIKAAMYEWGRARAVDAWGDGGGSRGRFAAGQTMSGTSFTLRDTKDIVHFEEGMLLDVASDDGNPATAGIRTGQLTVSAVNIDAGSFTVSTAASTAIPAITTNDYLFRHGDYGNVGTGVLGWVPATAPTSGDSFFGLDRSSNPVRLAGSRYAAGGAAMESAIIQALAQGRRNGGKFDTLWLSSFRMANLLDSMQSKIWVPVATDTPAVSFDGLSVRTPSGKITVLEDPACPDAYGLITRRQDWECASTKKGMPHFANEDGLKWRTETNSDSVEARLKAYYQYLNHNPVNNMLIDWDN